MPKTYEITSLAPESTQALAEKLGALLPRGALLTLEGDLGSGKTTFSQGLARGLAVPEAYYVTSPTFAIINEYPARVPFYHMDFYRLNAPGELEDLGFYDILRDKGVVVIEWAAKFAPVFAEMTRLEIRFEDLGGDLRKILLIPYGQVYENLIHEVVRMK